jgi:hypothetical protein
VRDVRVRDKKGSEGIREILGLGTNIIMYMFAA